MAIMRVTVIWCDNQCESGPVEGDNAREVTKEARAQGWKVNASSGTHLCPDCADWDVDEDDLHIRGR